MSASELRFAKPSATALVLVDMQNDFLHPKGAYGRAGQTAPMLAALSPRLVTVADAMRKAGGWIVSTQFTLVPGKGGEPFISEHLRRLRPFLGKGDFAPGSWGHGLVDELAPADLTVEKIAYSAFYMTRLQWVLQRVGVEHLVFGGIVTNGGVASTVRNAHVLDYELTVLSDGCAAFTEQAHEVCMASMGMIARVASCAEVVAALG